ESFFTADDAFKHQLPVFGRRERQQRVASFLNYVIERGLRYDAFALAVPKVDPYALILCEERLSSRPVYLIKKCATVRDFPVEQAPVRATGPQSSTHLVSKRTNARTGLPSSLESHQ